MAWERPSATELDSRTEIRFLAAENGGSRSTNPSPSRTLNSTFGSTSSTNYSTASSRSKLPQGRISGSAKKRRRPTRVALLKSWATEIIFLGCSILLLIAMIALALCYNGKSLGTNRMVNMSFNVNTGLAVLATLMRNSIILVIEEGRLNPTA